MDFLLDTHTLLWTILDDKNLSLRAKTQISDTTNTCYYSACSLWEITIKYSLGALDIVTSLDDCFNIISNTGLIELPLRKDHFMVLSTLPFHHKDPFDRLLIAQAIADSLKLVTKDSMITKYDVATFW